MDREAKYQPEGAWEKRGAGLVLAMVNQGILNRKLKQKNRKFEKKTITGFITHLRAHFTGARQKIQVVIIISNLIFGDRPRPGKGHIGDKEATKIRWPLLFFIAASRELEPRAKILIRLTVDHGFRRVV